MYVSCIFEKKTKQSHIFCGTEKKKSHVVILVKVPMLNPVSCNSAHLDECWFLSYSKLKRNAHRCTNYTYSSLKPAIRNSERRQVFYNVFAIAKWSTYFIEEAKIFYEPTLYVCRYQCIVQRYIWVKVRSTRENNISYLWTRLGSS